MAVASFRDLRVWQVGMELVQGVYEATAAFPHHELYGLTNQIRRAAVSIPSNIAEGHTRESTREYLQHVSVAQGSLAELQTQLEIATRLTYLPPETSARLVEQSASLSRQPYALRNDLGQRITQRSAGGIR